MEVKRILSDLVNIDTHTDKDTLDAVNWVQQYLLSYGVESKLVYNLAKTRASIYANIGKVDKAIILIFLTVIWTLFQQIQIIGSIILFR